MAVRRLMSMVLLLLAANVHAQQFPAKPIRLILPFPTGSGFVIGQVLSEGLRDTFKPGVVSEPRSGGGGSIAMETVAPRHKLLAKHIVRYSQQKPQWNEAGFAKLVYIGEGGALPGSHRKDLVHLPRGNGVRA